MPMSLCSRALEPQVRDPCAGTTEAYVLQLLKPAWLEPVLCKRNHLDEKPMHSHEE